MTLKDALEERKTSMKRKVDEGFWAVRIDVEVVEPVHIIEYVKASSGLEAQTLALKQFEKRTPALVHDRAARAWDDDGRHKIQHLHVTHTKPRKKFILSKLQRKILKELLEGKYLTRGYTRWALVNPLVSNKWGSYESESVSSISIDSLFQKGLLIDLVTSNMSDTEVDVQTALGSMPELEAYTVDREVLKTLGIRI
ncbi:hypothetical protein LCGC14_2021650 [marine sediment metagenome]|uniref:Uncharacterized protein n=1 Tax=marine sediment metagenome TaxID=412755 RepID=A0A0F9FJY1_9ZZZZ